MPPREDLILMLDLETTGTSVPEDEIIEVGLVLLSTDTGYPEIDAGEWVIVPSDEAFMRMMKNDVVRNMHESNGLLDDIHSGRGKHSHSRIDVEADIIRFLNKHTDGDTTHIPYGGSGVSHFDRRFIKHFLPYLDSRITHWAYDVGVMRRMFIKAGAPYAALEGSKTHRALDDARVHADEFRWYQSFLRGER